MKHLIAMLMVAAAVALAIAFACCATAPTAAEQEIALPPPVTTGTMSLEEALAKRRSVRTFQAKPLTQQQLGQLLWAAQGITDPATGHRTAPSAMAKYPLTVYVFDSAGVFSYEPKRHKLLRIADQDRRAELAQGGQPSLRQAPVIFVFTGDPSKLGSRAAERARDFTWVEAGHAAQNLALEATALALGTVTIGGFDPAAVAKLLNLPEGNLVLYLMPVGYPATR
jgi:SagB-type dehydrogenase family enzyme